MGQQDVSLREGVPLCMNGTLVAVLQNGADICLRGPLESYDRVWSQTTPISLFKQDLKHEAAEGLKGWRQRANCQPVTQYAPW